jgi:predicted DCC family thiol-disulfide oxidoreductase YuxK
MIPSAEPAGPVVLVDGVCNLCNRWVTFLIDRDSRRSLRFASLQSNAARRLLASAGWRGDPSALDTVLLVDGGRVYDRSTAVLRTLRHLGGAWRGCSALEAIPLAVRDAVYRWVAAHRYAWFGRSDACRIPTPELRDRFLTD